jgi:hypothetical protein
MNTNRITLISLFATVILPLAACNQMTPTPPSQDAPAEIATPVAAPLVSNPQIASLTATRYFSSRTFYNTADLRRDNGYYSVIALTPAGNSVIAYYDAVSNDPGDRNGPYGNGDLKLVVCNDPMCINPVVTTVDRDRIQYTEDVGSHVSMVLDAKGYPVIAYTSKEDGLKLAHCGDATCTSRNSHQVLTPGSSSGQFGNTSLVLDRKGNPVISYATKDPATGSAFVGLAHCYNANCDPNGPLLRDVPSGSTRRSLGVGLDNSLALDMNDYPVISYYDTYHRDLMIAHCTTYDCSERNIRTQIVDSAGDVGRYNSLVLVPVRDARGQIKEQRPFISYYDATNGDLKIADCGDANCSSGNRFQTLDSQGDVGQMTSLKRASDGSPIISYFDATNRDLKIAYCDPGESLAKVPTLPCQEMKYNIILTIDSVGDAGQNSSLALDANNKPVISYYQATYASLRVIRGQ